MTEPDSAAAAGSAEKGAEPRESLRARIARYTFFAGVLIWPVATYPLYFADQTGWSVWSPGPWSTALPPVLLVALGAALWEARRRSRVIAIGAVVALEVLLWVWPFGAGFYSPDAFSDRLVASLVYPVLAVAYVTLREWGPKAYLGLAPVALILVAGTAMWPGPNSWIPWSVAWRSNAWAVGPLAFHVSGAGLVSAIIAYLSAWLSETISQRARNRGSASLGADD